MKKILIGMTVLAMVASVHAAVIAGFDFAGTTSDPWAAATADPNAPVTGLTRVGLGAASSANAFGSNGWNLGAFAEGGDYLSFSLTPASGYELTLTGLTWNSLNGSNTGPQNGRWGYNIGGGAFTYQTDFSVTFANAGGSWDIPDVSGITQTVEVRFWAWGPVSVNGGSSAAAGSVTYRNGASGDDLVLNGTVTRAAIPEPGVMALLTLGGLSILRFARRRKE